MRKYKIDLILIAAIILSVFIFFGLDWNNLSFKIINKTNLNNGLEKYTLEDKNNHQFDLILLENVNSDRLKIIENINNIIFNIKFIKINRLNYYVSNRIIEITIVPKDIIINNKKYNEYFPVGVKFYFFDSLYYKIKIFTKNNFIEIEDKFIDEKNLIALILNVIDNPEKFLSQNNLQYLLKKVENQQREISKLEKDLGELKTQVKNNKEEMDSKISLINQYIAYLQDTALTLGNQGLFKGPTKISKNVVEAIIKIKKESSDITVKEIINKLKTQNLVVSEWEVKLVLLVFFDQF